MSFIDCNRVFTVLLEAIQLNFFPHDKILQSNSALTNRIVNVRVAIFAMENVFVKEDFFVRI